MNGLKVKTVVVEGADHDLIWAHPDKWLRAVEEFIQGANSADLARVRLASFCCRY